MTRAVYINGAQLEYEHERFRRAVARQEHQPAGLFEQGRVAGRQRRHGRGAARCERAPAGLDREQHAVRRRHDARVRRAAHGRRLGPSCRLRALLPRRVPANARVHASHVRREAARGVAGCRAARERHALRVPVRPRGDLQRALFRADRAGRDLHGALPGRRPARPAHPRGVCHTERAAVPDRVRAARREDCVVLQRELCRAVCAVCVVLDVRVLRALAARVPVQDRRQRRHRRAHARPGEVRQLHGHDVHVVLHLRRGALLQRRLGRRRVDAPHADVPHNRLEVLGQPGVGALPGLHQRRRRAPPCSVRCFFLRVTQSRCSRRSPRRTRSAQCAAGRARAAAAKAARIAAGFPLACAREVAPAFDAAATRCPTCRVDRTRIYDKERICLASAQFV